MFYCLLAGASTWKLHVYRYGNNQSIFRGAVFRLWGQLFCFGAEISIHLKGGERVAFLTGAACPNPGMPADPLERAAFTFGWTSVATMPFQFSQGFMLAPNPQTPLIPLWIKINIISKPRIASFASYSLDRGEVSRALRSVSYQQPSNYPQAQILPSVILGPSARPIWGWPPRNFAGFGGQSPCLWPDDPFWVCVTLDSSSICLCFGAMLNIF